MMQYTWSPGVLQFLAEAPCGDESLKKKQQ